MKKILLSFMVIMVLLMAIPVCIGLCFGKGTAPRPMKNFAHGTDESIKYLDVIDNKIKTCELEKYLVGVLACEMPAEYEPEALKAQAVAARSYILSKMKSKSDKHPDAVVCTDSGHCKGYADEQTAKSRWDSKKADRYWQKLSAAVESTKGEYMVCEEEIVEAFFFARSGGRTENSEDVWGTSRPYLKSVDSEGDLEHPEAFSTVEISNSKAREKLKSIKKSINSGKEKIKIGKTSRTEGGNVESIIFDGEKLKGTEVRKLFDLKSADFDVIATDEKLIFTVKGYGHGVGMSQFGANYMARNGEKYTEILSHYYTNIQIIKNQ